MTTQHDSRSSTSNDITENVPEDQTAELAAGTSKPRKNTVASNAAMIESMRDSFDGRLARIEVALSALAPQNAKATESGLINTNDPQTTANGQDAITHAGVSERPLRSHRFHPYAAPNHVATPTPVPTTSSATTAAGLQAFLTPAPDHQTYAPTQDTIDPNIDDQVRSILETTAHHLVAKGKKGIYPHNHVFKGPKKEKSSLGELSLAEHAWGIMRIIESDKTPADIKPHLVTHLDEVLEDARDFSWPNVRRWSEEIFALVAESRLKGGWANDNRIQMLRMSMSRVAPHTSAGAISGQSKSQSSAGRPHPQSATTTTELKGGPPCKEYNAGNCTLQSGHIVDSFRRPHICSYCLTQLSSIHQHPEKECRIKARQVSTHSKKDQVGFRQ